MIYPRKIILDMGDTIDFWVFKTEKLRTSNHDLNAHLRKYISAMEMVIHAEKLIISDLEFVYQGETIFDQLIEDLKLAVKHKETITIKELSSLKKSLEKS